MRACYVTSSAFIFLTTSLILGLSAPVAAQDGETDRIRIHIFASDESSSKPIDLNLPAGEWEFAPLAFAEEGSQYSYSSRQGPNAIEQLTEGLQRTDERRQLMQVVETEQEADIMLEIVATEVRGTIKGANIFRDGDTQGTVSSTVREDVILARLVIPNMVFTTDFLGAKDDRLRGPGENAAAMIEEWIGRNLDALQQLIATSY